MADNVMDGQNRQVYDSKNNIVYKVIVPVGWTERHPDGNLDEQYKWGDIYNGNPDDIEELPNNIKEQFGLNIGIGGRRSSKKNPTARRRRRSSKVRKSRKSRKARTTRRR